MNFLCGMFRIGASGYYKHRRQRAVKILQDDEVIKQVGSYREKLPMLGGRKLYKLIKPALEASGIKLGRDKFFDLLRRKGILVHLKRRYKKTTNSAHKFRLYDNLIKDIQPTSKDQVYVTDITYIRVSESFGYLTLITDLYSRKIVGYDFSKSLGIEGSIRALEMALKGKEELCEMIHHSDRGIQYCSGAYTKILKEKEIRISMSERGNPYENAVAERMNGILKTEFMLGERFNTMTEASKAIKEAIGSYNELRPHMSLNYLTPNQRYAA